LFKNRKEKEKPYPKQYKNNTKTIQNTEYIKTENKNRKQINQTNIKRTLNT
jgi:hypothetical protein